MYTVTRNDWQPGVLDEKILHFRSYRRDQGLKIKYDPFLRETYILWNLRVTSNPKTRVVIFHICSFEYVCEDVG